jgi:hypothetical protein
MCAMSEMQCAGVRPYNLQSTMCVMSEMQCVPSSRKTYPCQKHCKHSCCPDKDLSAQLAYIKDRKVSRRTQKSEREKEMNVVGRRERERKEANKLHRLRRSEYSAAHFSWQKLL